MRLIPTTLHGLVDYAEGIVMLGLPFFLGFCDIYETSRDKQNDCIKVLLTG